MRRSISCFALAALVLCPHAVLGQAAQPTDLDAFMARALQRRDVDRQTLTDYVLDEVEEFEILGPGRVPVARMRREFTWYVRDGIHVRSPLKFDGIPIPEHERRAYEDRWVRSEEQRRTYRTERDAKRAAAGRPPALSAPSINEPRFVSESYFMDFKFEPGNYYLAGKETVEGQTVLKVDYLPTRLFNDNDEERRDARERPDSEQRRERDRDSRSEKQRDREKRAEAEIDRKMNKSSQVTLWVDPVTHQIVKYTFDNVWLDFLPAGWIVRIDDLRASMHMGQPFPGVWLPRDVSIHAGVTLALGSMELQYKREFSKYRKAEVSSRVSVPKEVR